MKLSIREAKATDCHFILNMIKELAEFEKLAHQVSATENALRENIFGKEPKAFVLIAELDQTPVGFALYFYNFSTFLAKPGIYLEDLYVQSKYRSHGVGKALLKSLAQIAKDKSFGRLEWSVLDWNQKAIDFYLKIGAEPMNEWTVYRLTESAIKKLAEI